ncbi:MAG: YicC family protein [Lachnospiraceae bacterium]|nr:YicC family protein [Lachnospiraceae bacterium]
MKSMTGFGRGEKEAAGHQFTIEIKTVNSRYLETNLRVPHQFNALEGSVRSIIKENVARGKADVTVRYVNHSREQGEVWVNMARMQEYSRSLGEAAANLGLENDLKMSNIVNLPGVVESESPDADMEVMEPILSGALREALEALDVMRLREGENLKQDFAAKLSELEAHVLAVEKEAPGVVAGYKEKLYARLEEHLDKTKLQQADASRLEQEITLFADKCCIDEELTRLHSHIRQYREIIEKKEPIGRQLDFLTQELNRECNTIASKSNDLEITRHALAMKNIVEKIREQIQNIE